MQTVSRLIESYIPENYHLSLTLNRPERTFEGTVTITGAAPDARDEIRLHAKELTIASVTLDGKQADFQAAPNDELVITHPDIIAGKHIVVVRFSGAITDGMHGLYPCYFEHDGVKKELLATQFESHHAREVFPCIDEPEAKATFDVTLTTETGVTVLGNMPVKDQRTEDGRLVTQFQTTPRMSSYLLAWVVGELHKKSGRTQGGVDVNIWATPAQPAATLDFALDIAVRTIDFFDEYFGTPYPLPKSDHVALPDFSSGAMENWGLITYREVALLADPQTTSIANKHYIATVIAHELSHQWFGNLVTMKWWNDLWLNESFANMMEYLAVDALEPSWKIWLDHASHEAISALRRDSLDGVQAIQTDVAHPDEIGTLFDPSIVYAKGSRLLRMLQTYIGDKGFQAGLKQYFKKYAYQNTAAGDLWECLSKSSGQDIGAFMESWIAQPGFPVVHVAEKPGSLVLTQERFFIGPHQISDAIWPIPLGATDPSLPRTLAEKSITLKRQNDAPFLLNSGSPAHFITHYSPGLLAVLLESLDSFPEVDRLQLLHEQTLLAQAGIISSAELIPLLDHYRNEEVEAVWDIIAVAINELKRFVETSEAAEKKLRAFTGELAAAQFDRLGWQAPAGEDESDTKLRSTIISLMLYSERSDIIDHAKQLYASTPLAELDPELRVSIMAAVVRYAPDQTVVDELLAAHQATSSSELQEDIAAALTSTKNDAVIRRLTGLLTDASIVRPQDFIRWFVWLLRNRYGRVPTWRWARDNWPWIEKTYKDDMHFDGFPRYIASALATPEQLAEYEEFFGPLRKHPALKRNIDIGIAELTGKVDLIKRDSPKVQQALLDL